MRFCSAEILPETTPQPGRATRRTVATSGLRALSTIADSEGSEDEITLGPSSRVAKGVVLPNVSAMERSLFKKERESNSPTDSHKSSAMSTSRESSIDVDTPGTTPAMSVRGTSIAKRKRSTLGQQLLKIEDSEEDEDDAAIAIRLQEEEYAEAGAVEPAKKRTKMTREDSDDDLSLSEVCT